MAEKFEVGKSYYPNDRAYDPVHVLKRTPKCIVVRGGSGNVWRMLVRTDADGNEYATDSTAPLHWRYALSYCADNPVDQI